MTKPFDMNVLLARINAAMKHTYQKELGESTLEVGGIRMDLVRHEVMVDGQVVEFSPKEYELLSFLMRHQGKMLTHRQILKEVWGAAHAHDKQYLRVYIMQVRQKMEKEPENPEYIVTEAGIGYSFDVPKKSTSEEAT
jgi:two-component system KDP operon response regulator KdpE